MLYYWKFNRTIIFLRYHFKSKWFQVNFKLLAVSIITKFEFNLWINSYYHYLVSCLKIMKTIKYDYYNMDLKSLN